MMQEQTLHKLRQIKARFEELQTEMGNPDVFADQERYLSIVKEAADLTELVETASRACSRIANFWRAHPHQKAK